MPKHILIFEPLLDGHHLEYVHHLYERAVLQKKDNFIFIVPSSFNRVKSMFYWQETENVKFDILSKEETAYCESHTNEFISGYRRTLLLKRKIKQHSASYVFLITMMTMLPFLVILLPRKIKVSGIIYRIYLYRWKKAHWKVRLSDVFKHLLLVRSACIKNIFILNDESAAKYLNKLYSTTKYQFIVDPVVAKNISVKDLRNEWHIPKDATVFLHFGSLEKRKGTLEILKAISLLSPQVKENCWFIFAGKIQDEIKSEFYNLYDPLKVNTHILVFDEFCSYDYLSSLCYTCDCILIPYKDTIQSSGVIGYGALYKKPVVCSDGLLGKLVKKNKLGLVLNRFTPNTLADLVMSFKDIEFKVSDKYIVTNTVDAFTLSLFEF